MEYICKCKKIDKETIVKSIKNGAKTFEDVQKDTGAGKGLLSCRGRRCKEQIEKLISENS